MFPHRFDFIVSVSIHTPREGGDFFTGHRLTPPTSVSIHTPREGGDVPYPFGFRIISPVSIHTPREGGDSRNNRKNSGNFCDVYNTISFLHKSA